MIVCVWQFNCFSSDAKMKCISFSKGLLVGMAILGLMFQFGCETKESDSDSASDTANVHPTPKLAPSAGYEFETPVRLTAGGEFVSVEAPGYACPTLADVDEDGKLDLVVGQFNNGHMQFCRNIAEDEMPPEFAKAEWIKSGDDRAEVPGVS
jgi:hypothetical protein